MSYYPSDGDPIDPSGPASYLPVATNPRPYYNESALRPPSRELNAPTQDYGARWTTQDMYRQYPKEGYTGAAVPRREMDLREQLERRRKERGIERLREELEIERQRDKLMMERQRQEREIEQRLEELKQERLYIIVRLDSTCPQDYVALAATDIETFHQCSISSDWTTPNVIKHFARVEEDLPANESSLSINRKYVLREEWVEECIAKKRLIDEREGFGGWEVKVTFDPSLASGPSRASKLSLPTVSAAASAPPSLLARIGSPSVSTPQDGDTSRDASIQTTFCLGLDHHPFKKLSLVLHGESSSSTVTLNKDDVEDRHRPRQLYLDPQPRPRSPTQPPPPLAQQPPQRPPTPPMPPRLSPPLIRALSRSSQSLPTPPAGGEPLAKQIPRASITTSTSTFISSPFGSSLRSRPAGRKYEDYRQESQRERPNYDNQRSPPRQSHVRERDIDHPGSRSRSSSPLASLPTDHPSRRDCRPSHSPPPARRRSPSPLAPAHQGAGPGFSQSNEQYLSSRPNTPPTPGVLDSPTSNNSLTANQMQTQAFNQSRNQGQNHSGHLPNVSQTPLTVSQPSQTSGPSQPTRPTTGPLSTSSPPSRQTQLQLSPQPSPVSQSNQSNQSASALLPTEVRPVPIAVPLTGRGAPHPRLTPASGPSAAQVRPPPNLSSRLSQPAQQAASPLPQPPLMQVQSQPGPPPSATQTVRPSQTSQQQPLPLLQLQDQTQPQTRSQSQSQQRIQLSSQRPSQNFPAPKTSQSSQATQATRLAPRPSSPPSPVAPLPGQNKGNTSSTMNTRQRANQGVKIPPLTRTRTGTATGTATGKRQGQRQGQISLM
ncbi:hypothetical protein I308_104032 [Cryptococcus tetragattii IND107]|uniref:BRCT domain-containing protein n=1 Tax=Cryptococcus tetragattii IND107 TaxID=1296105 RepID=A0ABR3BPP4_9TREE